jgi:hypothetical protein
MILWCDTKWFENLSPNYMCRLEWLLSRISHAGIETEPIDFNGLCFSDDPGSFNVMNQAD